MIYIFTDQAEKETEFRTVSKFILLLYRSGIGRIDRMEILQTFDRLPNCHTHGISWREKTEAE